VDGFGIFEMYLTRYMGKVERKVKSFEQDCGIITAFNSAYTPHENSQRTRQLEAKIQISKYGVKKITTSDCDKFFVLDIKNRGKLQDDLIKWSSDYEQENIYFVPKGTLVDDEDILYIDANEVSNYYEVANILGKWSMTLIANKDWREINV